MTVGVGHESGVAECRGCDLEFECEPSLALFHAPDFSLFGRFFTLLVNFGSFLRLIFRFWSFSQLRDTVYSHGEPHPVL